MYENFTKKRLIFRLKNSKIIVFFGKAYNIFYFLFLFCTSVLKKLNSICLKKAQKNASRKACISDCRKAMFFDLKRVFEGNSLKTKNRQKSGHVPDFWLIARVGAVSAARAKTLESKRMRAKLVLSLKVSTLSARSKMQAFRIAFLIIL